MRATVKRRRFDAFRLSCVAALAAIVSGCSGPFLTPNPPPSAVERPMVEPPMETPPPQPQENKPLLTQPPSIMPDNYDGNVDFTGAFDDGAAMSGGRFGYEHEFVPLDIDTLSPQPPLRYPPFKARKRPVRVMVRGGVKQATVQMSGAGSVVVRAESGNASFRGRMHVEVAGGRSVVATVDGAKRELSLPCTLFVSSSGEGLIRLGDESYRGALVIVPDQGMTVMILNVLDVEDYLRGVVPLEIGNLREPDIEAVKAQAVAARTYTYQRMAMRASGEYDLVNTVSDQVYGGSNAEGTVPDLAIRLTKDLVLVHGEQLVNAYYHSTCGGVTANIEDVWGSNPQPYLRSVPDTRPDGRAYCGESNWFTWTESWSTHHITGIIKRYAEDGRLQPAPYKGSSLRGMVVRDRFACGRVKTLQITTNSGEYAAGGDRVRFLLRRDAQGNPILRSSFITDIKVSGSTVSIAGRGHGHGIGMCQVGAIHRARDRQTFEEILSAYYSGVTIRTVVD